MTEACAECGASVDEEFATKHALWHEGIMNHLEWLRYGINSAQRTANSLRNY